MANFYIAVTVKQDRNEIIFEERTNQEPDPGYYAYVRKLTEADNLVSVLASIGGLIHANVYPTRKKAVEVVDAWNASYKANGQYLFD